MSQIVTAIVLSLIQGLTEFLPISSTAHVLLAEKGLGLTQCPSSLFYSVLQLGSIAALLSVYGKSLWQSLSFLLYVALATLPAVIFGAIFHSYVKTVLYNATTIGVTLIIGGLLFIYLGRGRAQTSSHIGPWQALTIGFAQAVALIPGVSRSGATIASGVCLGLDLTTATAFSFTLAIPVLCGATLFDIAKSLPQLTVDHLPILALGFSISAAASFLVIRPFVRFIERRGLAPFGWYRIALGLAILYCS